jgi:hypothetical protein
MANLMLVLTILLTLTLFAGAADAQTSARQLLTDFLRNPATHPNVPDVSYAGYRQGEKPLPQGGRVVANVREQGAKGDGKTDDTAAFAKAIDTAHAAGGGVIRIPAGNYLLSDVIRLKHDNIILRGDKATTTTLTFSKSLTDALGERRAGGSSEWSWSGGMIWVGPADTWDEAGKLARDFEEYKRAGESIAKVTDLAPISTTQVVVDEASSIKPGDTLTMIWTDPTDNSFVQHVAGHESMKSADFGGLSMADWFWVVEIDAVDGNKLTLAQPLRVDARPEWNVRFTRTGPMVREVGIEELTLKFPPHKVARHLQDVGFNGPYFNRAIHCWAKNIVVENYDIGVGLSAAKNVTVSGLLLRGQASHHGTANRNFTHDCLIESFRIDNQPFHGINTEGMSSGNVWRDGEMKFGTFDSHRGMSFDSVRTNIRLSASGRPGGGNNAGPFLGKRIVHWNIKQAGGSGEWTNSPDYLPMGALVGVQGVQMFRTEKPFAMPPGDKGCLIIDAGKLPDVEDLYTAQREARLKKQRSRRP